MRRLTKEFHERFYDEYAGTMPSLSTVYRAVRRGNTRKVVSWHNIREDPIKQLEYFADIAHIHEDFIVDIDGMVQNHKDFLLRYG
jgi:hypothetical protein